MKTLRKWIVSIVMLSTLMVTPAMAFGEISIPGLPVITHAEIDYGNMLIYVDGHHFGSQKGTLKLGDTPLVVQGWLPEEIIAKLPSEVVPGSYLLTVVCQTRLLPLMAFLSVTLEEQRKVTVSLSDQVQALAALMGRLEFAGEFPANALKSFGCGGGDSTTISFEVNGGSLGEVVGLLGVDRISSPYAYSVAIQMQNSTLNLDSLVGQGGKIVYQRGGRTASFSGVITEFGLAAANYGGRAIYIAKLEPSFAILERSTDYLIYQDLSSVDIVRELLNSTGLTNFDLGLVGQYGRIEFEMMYDESPRAFVSRLMERDGIHYHFRESGSLETLVIGDANTIFTPVGTPLTYYGHLANPGAGAEFIATFQRKSSLFTGNAAAGGYDFTRPTQNISGSASEGGGVGEKFEFASDITALETAQFRAQMNLQRELVHRHQCLGTSNAPALRAGHSFSLVDASGAGFGDTYLVTEIRHMALIDEGSGCMVYANSFSAIPNNVTFRPQRKTPTPKVPGVVTAVVTGPAGETRHVDEYGRIKVRFLWDRYGSNDERSSAWIRVMIPTGRLKDRPSHLFIPEKGSEVVVSFLQGNPSLPVVLGSLYNTNFMPPLELPENK